MTPPPDAVTVRVEVAAAAVDATFSVNVLLPLPGVAILAGAKLPVTPFGSPLTDSVTADLKPLTPAVDTVTGIDPPRATITFVPPSVSVNVGPITVRLRASVLVTPPPVACTVSENVPPTAVAAAVSVSVLLPVPGEAMLVGANLAVTPVGSPVTENAIAALNPFIPVAFNTTLAGLPAVTVAFAESAVSANVGTITVKLIVCVLVTPPPVPFNVNVEAPPTTAAVAFSVSVLLPLPAAILAGAKLAVTPAGSPLTDKATADLNPATGAAETVTVVELPAVTVALVAPGVSVKPGAATVKAIGVLRVSPPPLPVIVTVELPATAPVDAVKVAVTGALAVAAEEENCTLTPVGVPLADSVTGALNPPCGVIVSVALLELPGATETLETLGVSVKFNVLPSLQ